MDADASALVAGVGQGGQSRCHGVVERGQGVDAGGMMSCTEPGSASETRSGKLSGAMTAWMLPP